LGEGVVKKATDAKEAYGMGASATSVMMLLAVHAYGEDAPLSPDLTNLFGRPCLFALSRLPLPKFRRYEY
jgi:hypothetical protein